ncbi:hypothetical protein H920_13819 [Fukomys damarensis]|uniref:Uncharacterized protein n=1 Tax=Fukomys damarensis TaxID=885580 RepID=A0A091D2T5_FUKDA|nr:hypothetical protein H920_13819 [Fukomys damarensis]
MLSAGRPGPESSPPPHQSAAAAPPQTPERQTAQPTDAVPGLAGQGSSRREETRALPACNLGYRGCVLHLSLKDSEEKGGDGAIADDDSNGGGGVKGDRDGNDHDNGGDDMVGKTLSQLFPVKLTVTGICGIIREMGHVKGRGQVSPFHETKTAARKNPGSQMLHHTE